MTDIIHLLSDSVANQIAAGEVVQRPASVVKELMENALDAGAKQIELHIRDAGKTFIMVKDDGCGMSDTDARMSFERHATSKIYKAEDLYNIRTLGFRGEALASIASVARVEMKTKRTEDEVGVKLEVDGGEVLSQEAEACPNGTTITVKNLFFNIPVRKNFLKSDQVEYKQIVQEFFHIALPNPHIKFIMKNENQEIYHLLPGSLKQRIANILGKKYNSGIVPVEEESPLVKLHGFIGKPELARKTRGEQFLFANNRFIRNPYFNHAILSAYDTLLASGSFPFYTLFLNLSSKRMDVNVHPTKTEVKFEDEKALYSIIRASVKRSIAQHHILPSLDFEQEAFHKNILDEGNFMKTPAPPTKSTLPYEGPQKFEQPGFKKMKSSDKDWKNLMDILREKSESENKNANISDPDIETENDSFDPGMEGERKIIQIHQKYILTPIHSGLVLIHQYYAHQRILYENYIKTLKTSQIPSQQELFPEVIEFNEEDFMLFNEISGHLKKLGFGFELFGKRTIIMNGTPAGSKTSDPASFIEKFLEEYKNNLGNKQIDPVENVARSMAINTAIKSGQSLSKEEMNLLVDQLFACNNPYYSPLGRPIFMTISKNEIDKKFE
jgi:DNA mismatch repair protein MutL